MPSAPTGPAAAPRHRFYGRTIARCRVGDRLGRGATSAVFRAHYEPLGREIAIKILSPDKAGSAELRARFLQEARSIAKLDHENIVKVYDIVEAEGLLCILMELVRGDTLQDRLADRGRIEPRRALRIAAQVARALEAAHAEKIVHRDIKPANVMLEESGRVRVVDFGLAAQTVANRVGTPFYMSPEAAQGKRIDEKSDIYALGVCLYQMLTGKLPFTGETVKEILAAHVTADLVPPSKVRPELGARYDDLLRKMLVKAKGYRPSAGEVAAMLDALAPETEEEKAERRRRPSYAKRAVEVRRRSMIPLVVASAGGIVLIALVVLVATSASKKVPAVPGPTSGAATQGPPGAGGQPVTGTVSATPKPADSLEEAKRAFLEVEEWVAAHPAEPAEAAKHWRVVAAAYPGNVWGDQAKVKAAKAEEDVKKEAQLRADEEKRLQEREARLVGLRADWKKLDDMIQSLDFEGAARVSEGLKVLPEQNAWELRPRQLRLQYLGENFVKRLDDAFRNAQPVVRLGQVAPDPKETWKVAGAAKGGLPVEDGPNRRTVPWKEVQTERLFDVLANRLLDQRAPEDCLFLAILAKEIGLEEKSKRFRRQAEFVDKLGELGDRMRDYFPGN